MQAQTVANFYLAFEQNLAIVPVLNKCDMTNAEPDQVADQMQQVAIPPPFQFRQRMHELRCQASFPSI
jgi:translation elongation factor EF-4